MSELFKTLGMMPLSAEIYTKSGVEELVNSAVTGGVTSLLKFVGISSTDPLSEGGATVTGVSAFVEGNVVLWKPEGSSEYSEYVYATVDGALKWERLGDASRIGQLEQRVSTAESDIENLDGRMTTAEGEIDALQADIVKKADISALNDGLALKADLTALNAVDGRLSTAEGEIDALQGEMAQAKIDIAANTKLINDNKTATDAAIALKADITALDAVSTTVTELSEKVDSNKTYCDEQFQSLGGQISTLESEVVPGINGRIDDLDSRLGDLNQSVTNCVTFEVFQDITGGLDSRLSAAEGEIDALQADIATKAAAADLTALDGEVEALAGRVTTAEGEIDALQAAVATKAESSVVEGIDSRLSAAEGEIDGLQAEIATKADAADVVAKDLLMVFDQAGAGATANIGDKRIIAQTEDGECTSTFSPDGYSMNAYGQTAEYTAHGIQIIDSSSGTDKHFTLSFPTNVTEDDFIEAGIATSLDIEALQAVIDTKAAAADLTALAGRVTTAEGEIDALQAAVATKAESSELTAFQSEFTNTIDIIWNAAGEAQEAIANVTTVNELISVLSTYFGKFSA